MSGQDNTGSSAEFTVEELLSMFKTEAKSICKNPEDILIYSRKYIERFY